jgi:hypothetical protein
MRRAAALLSLVFLGGCGYALEGRGIAQDPSIKRIGVPLFKDSTGRAGLDQKVTEKVIAELLKRGHFDVVQDATGIDALVEGTIVNYRAIPVGFNESGSGTESGGKNRLEASRYAVVLTVAVKYSKPGVTEPLWQTEQLSVRDETDVGDDPEAFFDREDQVLDRLSQNLAKTLVSSMLEAF